MHCLFQKFILFGLPEVDEAFSFAMRYARLCQTHQCSCGAKVGPKGTYGLTARRSAGRTTRQHATTTSCGKRLTVPNHLQSRNWLVFPRSDRLRPAGFDAGPMADVWPGLSRIYMPRHYSLTSEAAAEGAAGPAGAEMAVVSSHPRFHSAGL